MYFVGGVFFGAFKKNGCFKNYTTKTVAHGLCSDAHIFNAFFMVKLVAPDIMSRCAWQMQRHPNFTSRICWKETGYDGDFFSNPKTSAELEIMAGQPIPPNTYPPAPNKNKVVVLGGRKRDILTV